MVSTAAAIVIVAAMFAGLGFLVLGGPSLFYDSGAQQANVVNTGSSSSGNTISGTKTNLAAGDRVTLTNTHFDTLSRSALSETTNVVTTVLRAKTGAQFGVTPADNNAFYTIAATGNSQTFQLVDADNGLITVTLEPASAQAYRLDIDEFVLANPGIVERYAFYDWDDDSDKQFVIQVSTQYLKPIEQTENVPVLNLQVPWGNENTISLSAPADQSSLGTSPTTVTVYWEGTGTNNDVTYWRHVALRINQTGIDEFDLGASYVMLDGKRLLFSEATSYGAVGSNYEWKWLLGANIGEAPYHEFTTVAGTKVYLTTVLKVDPDSSDSYNTTLEVSSWDASGSPNVAVTDTVKLTA